MIVDDGKEIIQQKCAVPAPTYKQVISQRKLGVPSGLSLRMSIYGGETIKESAKRLETAPIDIICATPGRLIALLDETKLPGCIGYGDDGEKNCDSCGCF